MSSTITGFSLCSDVTPNVKNNAIASKAKPAKVKLFDHVENIACSRNHTKIELQSMRPPKLVEFYQLLGYQKTGVIEPNETYGKLIEMEKNLN